METKLLKHKYVRKSKGKIKIPTGPPQPPGRGDVEKGKKTQEGAPELDLIKNEEDMVTHMHVKCPCGKELMVECDYMVEE